ncbi:hypothetical protein HC028_23570 [Planosporangium flavigriseum]|uniref:Uncharacterized protein n=2 Tax=Planosporangium flavigriseum TaxID=373681 RepID=A0A8J3LKJ6_9ACTN|nr:hypothetical protein [Planosporangium flavigriseum]NJC67455.1 hypothetical protein [Planosporangium flavigriseum]GIG74903.1 hypothetical protein Pfl04_33070 [Planosporangium flavigriseum]
MAIAEQKSGFAGQVVVRCSYDAAVIDESVSPLDGSDAEDDAGAPRSFVVCGDNALALRLVEELVDRYGADGTAGRRNSVDAGQRCGDSTADGCGGRGRCRRATGARRRLAVVRARQRPRSMHSGTV